MSRFVITGRTRLGGVVGSSIRHSLSPLIHNAWLAATEVDAVYVPFETSPDRFEAFIDAHRGGGLVGVNVTLPFKERAVQVADHVHPAALAAGAANLLVFDADGAVTATNTDGIGMLDAFAEQAPGWRPSDRPVVVLGAGGAARGAVAALIGEGAEVRVVNRTLERARALQRRFNDIRIFDLKELNVALADAGALINATPSGFDWTNGSDPPLQALIGGAVVMDMVYAPLETPLLRVARRQGLATVDGLAMLIAQARPSFEMLFGQAAPDTVDVRALAIRSLRLDT